jgi:hypothetical protein
LQRPEGVGPESYNYDRKVKESCTRQANSLVTRRVYPIFLALSATKVCTANKNFAVYCYERLELCRIHHAMVPLCKDLISNDIDYPDSNNSYCFYITSYEDVVAAVILQYLTLLILFPCHNLTLSFFPYHQWDDVDLDDKTNKTKPKPIKGEQCSTKSKKMTTTIKKK